MNKTLPDVTVMVLRSFYVLSHYYRLSYVLCFWQNTRQRFCSEIIELAFIV